MIATFIMMFVLGLAGGISLGILIGQRLAEPIIKQWKNMFWREKFGKPYYPYEGPK